MKKHNTIKVVLLTIAVLTVLTWIFPAAYFQGEFMDQGRVQAGLFDLFNYPITAVSYFGYIALYIIMVGGFYGILYKIPAYRNLLDKIVKMCEGKEKIVISVVMVLLAIATSICGLQLGLVLFFPFIVSIILLMGYDKIVAALTVVGSTMVGIAGTTYGSNAQVLNSALQTTFTDNMAIKVIILVVGLALLIFNTIMYMKKVNVVKKPTVTTIIEDVKEEVEEKVEEIKEEIIEVKEEVKKEVKKASNKSKKSNSKKKKSKSHNKAALFGGDLIVVKEVLEDDGDLVPKATSTTAKVWPIVAALSVLLVVLILAFIPWSTAFGLTAMEDAKTAITEFELFGFPLFAKLLGNVNTFGEWMVSDMIFGMMLMATLLVVICKVKLDDAFDGFVAGAKKALAPAVVSVLLYTILVLATYHPFQLTIYKAIIGLTGKNFNVFTGTITALISSIVNVDPAYAFQSVVPYMASVITDGETYPIIAILFQSMYGVAMLFAPTSLILMGTLSYLGVSYKEWLKAIWKLLVELIVVLLIILVILVLI